MERCYVIGPISAPTPWEVEQNIRKAEEITVKLLSMGYAVHCPHLQARFIRGNISEERLIETDLEWLSCSDFAVIYTSISKSEGSKKEIIFCKEHNIPIYYMLWGTSDILYRVEWVNDFKDIKQL